MKRTHPGANSDSFPPTGSLSTLGTSNDISSDEIDYTTFTIYQLIELSKTSGIRTVFILKVIIKSCKPSQKLFSNKTVFGGT